MPKLPTTRFLPHAPGHFSMLRSLMVFGVLLGVCAVAAEDGSRLSSKGPRLAPTDHEGAVATEAEDDFRLSRCEVIPLAREQVSFQIDGIERTRWHFGEDSPRPFFYPLNGPSGATLTRMGHPGAPNHDHHRSVWFAHHDVGGVDFWSDQTSGRVRQKQWHAYHDGDDQAVMAAACGWFDGDGRELMQQDTIAALLPMEDNEYALELQITLCPGAAEDTLELGKTNFGFLAVRVAKTLSVHFGGGKLTNSEGQQGEKAIFGNPARWVDYSGPVAVGMGAERKAVVEGITFFDHPENPRYPTRWHVREDGWMGASFCLQEGWSVTAENPLTLRYLLYVHRGPYDHAGAEAVHRVFVDRSEFEILKSTRKHHHLEVRRTGERGQ